MVENELILSFVTSELLRITSLLYTRVLTAKHL